MRTAKAKSPSLADELAETNQLLRAAVQPPRPEPPRPVPSNPLSRPPRQTTGATALLAAQVYWDMNILGDHFHDVPEDRIERDGKDVTVHCSCGHDSELRCGQLASCPCGRWYFSGNSVKWAPAPDPHDCKPNAQGWCDECGADL